jgi:protein-L-isoaspartate(D-aspartate) O-methyltransferase
VDPDQWRQTNITFADRDRAEHLAVTRIGPALADAEERGLISSWFFIRKDQWRLRWLPATPRAVGTVLQALASTGESVTWTSCVCEFETVAFGGAAGLDAACALFHADSRHLLHRLATSQPLRRTETSILLCSALMRAAGLDWFEQGDVWARVRDLRPGPPAIPADPQRARQLHHAMRTLMTTDARGLCGPATSGALAGCEPWIAAFEEAGQTLAQLNHDGYLERGLRAVLAHHLIFHFNRAGISGRSQATIAALAVSVTFHTTADLEGV